MDSKLNISRGKEDHRRTASNSTEKANKEVIASVANELKKIGDKLNSTYKLHFVNKVNLAG